MLKKLIKYDIKANIKVVAGTYSFITLLAVLHLIMDKLFKANPDAVQWLYIEKITFIAAIEARYCLLLSLLALVKNIDNL